MKKILSILSASALALTMSISAFADDKPSKEEIEKAYMEYAVDEAIGDESELENAIVNDFDLALEYKAFKKFLDSDAYKSNAHLANINDLSDKSNMNDFDDSFQKWLSNNIDKIFPIDFKDFDWEFNDKTQIWTGTSLDGTVYTESKSNGKWLLKDKNGKTIMSVQTLSPKFDYIYENAEKENSKDDDSSRSLVSNINDEEDSVEKVSENSTGESSGNNNNSTNEQSDQDNNSSSKNSSAGTNNNTQSGGTSDNGGSSPANGGKSEENSNGNSSNSSASESEENEEQEDSNTTVWVIVLVAVVAAGIIVFFVFKKKK